MKLYDEDKLKDEIVGSILFSLKDCIGDKVRVVLFMISLFISKLNTIK